MFGLDPDSVTHTFLNCLMVVGGFVVGYVVTALLAWGFDHWVSHRRSSPSLHKLARWLGGLIVAIIVGLFVFSGGFGRGGNGPDGKGGQTQSTSPGSAIATSTAPTVPATKPAPLISTNEVIRVTILGGFQADEKYYVAEDDGKRQTDFAGIKSYVLQRKKDAEKPVVLEIRLAALNKTTRGNPVVLQLDNWARNDERMTVTFPGDGP